MTDEQPDLRWAPLEPKPDNRGRVWLIVGLSVAVAVIVAVLLFFLVPRGDSPEPGASESPSASATPTTSASPSPSTSASTEPEPGPEAPATPITTPPPAPDPSIDAFRGQVQGWLDDAVTGLDIVSESDGPDVMGVVDTLQSDAQRLSEVPPPASIDAEWRDGAVAYAQRLSDLRSAVDAGGPTDSAVEAALEALSALRSTVGL